MSEKLVQMNPEMYTVWNYRRKHVAAVLAGGGDAAVEAAAHELDVTEAALMQNPKSYSTWHHRKWVVSQHYCSLEREVVLVERLLDADARNFHGWGYRRWLVGIMGVDRRRELGYSKAKIEENFSNYSAWHHRSVVLVLDDEGGPRDLTVEEIDEELTFVRQALYTDPGDQSGWFYHRWLVGMLMRAKVGGKDEGKHVGPATGATAAILRQELAVCRDVHSLDSKAKWPVVIARGLVRQLSALDADEGDGELTGWLEDKDAAWLERADPMRAGFYRDEMVI